MSLQGKDWAELLKFPLTIIIGIAAIVVGCLALGVKPATLQVGELKVELETELRKELVTSNLDINEQVRSEVRNQLKQFGLDSSRLIQKDTVAAVTNVVSDDVAKLAKIETPEGTGTVFKSTEGYIWIGNYFPKTNRYGDIQINVKAMSEIEIGKSYFVNGNMVIRQGSPVKNIDYYRGEKKVGLAVKGTEVQVLEKPEAKPFSNYQQFWVKIRVLK